MVATPIFLSVFNGWYLQTRELESLGYAVFGMTYEETGIDEVLAAQGCPAVHVTWPLKVTESDKDSLRMALVPSG